MPTSKGGRLLSSMSVVIKYKWLVNTMIAAMNLTLSQHSNYCATRETYQEIWPWDSPLRALHRLSWFLGTWGAHSSSARMLPGLDPTCQCCGQSCLAAACPTPRGSAFVQAAFLCQQLLACSLLPLYLLYWTDLLNFYRSSFIEV